MPRAKKPCYILPWPPPWKRNKPHRKLGWAARGHCRFEDGTDAYYKTKQELEDLLHAHAGYVLMPDFEFNKWVQSFVLAGDQCVYADAAERVVGFKSKRGRCIRYIYRAASAWPGIETVGYGGLARLRRFLDEWQLGDLATPGALGLALAEALMPPGQKFWRPPWDAWRDLHDHGVAGWVDLFMQYKGESACMVDMNSAYPAAARSGMPCGYCTPIRRAESEPDYAWTFCRYRWQLSSDPGVVQSRRFIVLALTNRDNNGTDGSGTCEPDACGDGWYTRVEADAARDSGAFAEFECLYGWGWEGVSTALSEWTERVDAAKAAYAALGPDYEIELGWVKRMSVVPFGRFYMDAWETHVYGPDGPDNPEIGDKGYGMVQKYGRHNVEIELVKRRCRATDPTKIPQLAIHVWTVTRMELAKTMELAADAGWQIFMCAIDGVYGRPVGGLPRLALDYGVRAGQWKQKELFDVNVIAAGTVTGRTEDGQRFVKMPGVKRGDPLRLGG